MMQVTTMRVGAAQAPLQRQHAVVLPRQVTSARPLWGRARRFSIALRRPQTVAAQRKEGVEAVGELRRLESKVRGSGAEAITGGHLTRY
jgi:hypothetical protein